MMTLDCLPTVRWHNQSVLPEAEFQKSRSSHPVFILSLPALRQKNLKAKDQHQSPKKTRFIYLPAIVKPFHNFSFHLPQVLSHTHRRVDPSQAGINGGDKTLRIVNFPMLRYKITQVLTTAAAVAAAAMTNSIYIFMRTRLRQVTFSRFRDRGTCCLLLAGAITTTM